MTADERRTLILAAVAVCAATVGHWWLDRRETAAVVEATTRGFLNAANQVPATDPTHVPYAGPGHTLVTAARAIRDKAASDTRTLLDPTTEADR